MRPDPEYLVICLCADWCGVCRDYRPGFEALAKVHADIGFHWVDIEDEPDWPDALEVESFPTVMIQRGETVLFLGPTLPQHTHLGRTLDSLLTMSEDEARRHVESNPERREWQLAAGLRHKLAGRGS